MRKQVALLTVMLACGLWGCKSNTIAVSGENNTAEILDLMAAENADHIMNIQKGKVEVIKGTTFRYTVDTPDTPEDGLVSTEATVGTLLGQLKAVDETAGLSVTDAQGKEKGEDAQIEAGDVIHIKTGSDDTTYEIEVVPGAVGGKLSVSSQELTAGTEKDLVLDYSVGQRTPDASVVIEVPEGIKVTEDNTTVNVIGRGAVLLSDLETQSPGRYGEGFAPDKVGSVTIEDTEGNGQKLTFEGLDLRPDNGIDLQLVIQGAAVEAPGEYDFKASYTTAEPEVLESPVSVASVQAVQTVTDFTRKITRSDVYDVNTDYQAAEFEWTPVSDAQKISLQVSEDKGATWNEYKGDIAKDSGSIQVSGLKPDMEYQFRLEITGGEREGISNVAKLYSGMYDIKKNAQLTADGSADCTDAVNDAIQYLNSLGGGTLLFQDGNFGLRTVHLASNVYLYINQDAVLTALLGGDQPEDTWYSDREFRRGASPTATGPYDTPENWLTKQDVGHTFFQNAMFFGERLDNIKIVGNGLITGADNLDYSDNVLDEVDGKRNAERACDKLISVKLCTNVEFGGLTKGKDLWYEETENPDSDEPFYLEKDGQTRDTEISNMLRVTESGHFVMLAAGTDGIHNHDVYVEKTPNKNIRDIFDFMECNDVKAVNIYAEGAADDIIKPGSDCGLGFTRPSSNFLVRNIIGDTRCNLFQIGSETVDDIQNICVDNVYVLASDKAAFSISTNDGGTVKNVHLNCGGTTGNCKYDIDTGLTLGYEPSSPVHHMSEFRRSRTPFFLSISNRGRTLGGQAERFQFEDTNGSERDELLSTNVNIGHVENIFINDVNAEECYAGSCYYNERWLPYTNQGESSPVIVGYAVPEIGPKLPDGRQVGYIENVTFENVNVLVKGGHPVGDANSTPGELGVGQYNVSNLSVQPSYGFWARHVKNLLFDNCSVDFEENDDRYGIVLNDVHGATIKNTKMTKGANNRNVLELLDSTNVSTKDCVIVDKEQMTLADLKNEDVNGKQTYPYNVSDNTALAINGADGKIAVDEENKKIQVAFGTDAEELYPVLAAADGSEQVYTLTTKEDETLQRKSGALENGDQLSVMAANWSDREIYTVQVLPSDVAEAVPATEDGPVLSASNGKVRVLEGTTGQQLFENLTGADGSEQVYETGAGKTELVQGDSLKVTSQNEKNTKEYTIELVKDVRLHLKDGQDKVISVDNQKGSIIAYNKTTFGELAASVDLAEGAKLDVVGKENEPLTQESRIQVVNGTSSQEYVVRLIDFESLQPIEVEAESGNFRLSYGKATSQNSTEKNSKNQLVAFRDVKKNDFVEYLLENVPAGKYELQYTYSASKRDLGIVQVSVNGIDLGDPIDEYAKTLEESTKKTVIVGTFVKEDTGNVTIRSTVMGKNPLSAKSEINLDKIALVPVK